MIRELELPRHELEPLENPGRVSGFISPADDYKQRRLHIAQRIVKDPTNTFYFEADDDQMRYYGIMKGSIIVVDKTVPVNSGMLIVCCVEDEWLTRRLLIQGESIFLCLNDTMDACLNVTRRKVTVFGAVTWTCLPHTLTTHVRTGRL
jgi:DNA polymerase V